jgi:hypothetical protein
MVPFFSLGVVMNKKKIINMAIFLNLLIGIGILVILISIAEEKQLLFLSETSGLIISFFIGLVVSGFVSYFWE